ncbi:MAG: hypothetical protein AAB462_00175 [Patescibacteria group bacterium]
MTSEIPKPEQATISPEQQAVADLSAVVKDVIDAQGVPTQTLEDGSQTRIAEVSSFLGDSLAETTGPDGSRSYEVTSFFSQSHDRGVITSSWQEGADTVTRSSKMEVAGDASTTYTTASEIKRVESDAKHIATKLPEREVQQKGRFSRVLGKLATRR